MAGSCERYTPKDIADLLQEALDGIDLDPASCKQANKIIKAKKFYTQTENGLTKPWFGKVFLNPPYSNMGEWIKKLAEEINKIESIIVLSNASTSSKWFNRLSSIPFTTSAFAFPDKRIKFLDQSGKPLTQPRYDSVFTHLGNYESRQKFLKVFSGIALVTQRVKYFD